ncbi:MAG TPA: efflux RND transporter periplasmic adaptor subunit [Gemmatimonadales bacterium]|jgi:cobalt-zinc-cadmium efflux system membrane fusion protein|nr:efflux RND transporter periplasmic adaptor subunit [Gemmatimonadales bacterium]
MTDRSARGSTILAAAVAAAVAGCSRGAEPRDHAPTSAVEASTVELDTAQRSRIRAERVVPRAYNALINTNGTVAFNGDRSTQVIAPISGPVSRILVAPGARVERGQPLATVSSPDFAEAVASYRKAEGAWRNAERIATLDEQLFANDALARSDLDQARTDLAAATADREAARLQLRSLGLDETAIAAIRDGKPVPAQGAVRAPIGGTLVERLITPGQLLQAGSTPCFTIADLSTVWVMANVFESDVGAVQRGEAAFITTDAAPDTLVGRVDYVADLVDPATKATAVRVVVPNRTRSLRRDMLVRVAIRASRPRTGITIPVAAVLRDDENLPFVYVTGTGGTFERRRVDLGGRIGDRYEVASGLKTGESVVTDGALFLNGASTQ